jgi:hypothetical protein
MTPAVAIASSYLSLVIDLPPLVAQAAYDAQWCTCGSCGSWCLTVASGRLLARVPRPVSRGDAPLRADKSIIVAGIWRWPAELELTPWSTERTQLGLRLIDLALLRRPPEHVLTAGYQALIGVSARLHGWSEQPLRELSVGAAVSE